MANMPDKAGKRLCEIEGYEQCMTRYWLDPDGTLWSGPSIKSWWTTASGTDVYDLATSRGRHTVSVSTLRRDALIKESLLVRGIKRVFDFLQLGTTKEEGEKWLKKMMCF